MINRRLQVQSLRGTPRCKQDLVSGRNSSAPSVADNTVSLQYLASQIDKESWRGTLARRTVMVHQHLDRTLTMTHGPRRRRITQARAHPVTTTTPAHAVERRRWKAKKRTLLPVWKYRRLRGIPTFQRLRPWLMYVNRTFHVLTTERIILS